MAEGACSRLKRTNAGLEVTRGVIHREYSTSADIYNPGSLDDRILAADKCALTNGLKRIRQAIVG